MRAFDMLLVVNAHLLASSAKVKTRLKMTGLGLLLGVFLYSIQLVPV